MAPWTSAKLSDFAQIIMGQSPDSAFYNTDGAGIPFLQGSAQFGRHFPETHIYCAAPTKVAPASSILFSVRAPVGEINRADRDYCIGRGVAAIVPRRIAPAYLEFCLRFLRPEFDHIAQGSTFGAINSGDFSSITLWLPSDRGEQEEIAAALLTLDRAIELAERLSRKYQRIRKGLIRSLLAVGIDQNGAIRSEATHAFKDSRLGRIPAEWEIVRTKDACALITKGTTPKKRGNESSEFPIPFLRVQNLTFDGRVDIADQCEFVSKETHRDELARSIVYAGDVLTNIVGPPLGKVSIVPADYPEWNLNQAIAIFRPTEKLSSEFLCYWLQAPMARNWFELNSKKTSGQQNLTLQHCQDLPLLLPSLDEQYRITTAIQAIERLVHLEEAGRRKMSLLQTGMMRDLITGKVPFPPLLQVELARAQS
jgi:type I restriction enzyme, S subunit